MNHSFNIDVATKYGIEEAIILENFYFWIEKNKANERNFYDGYYWTYNSQEAFSKLFPYLSKHKIYRVMKKLEDEGLIIKGNYNKIAYDRTTWYAITDKALSVFATSISQNCEMDVTELRDRNHGKVSPIPDINTDIKTDIKKVNPQHIELSKLLFELKKEINPKVKEPNFNKWGGQIRLMIERDGYTEKEIEDLIRWSQRHSFWYKIILSTSNLRKNAEQMTVQKQDQNKVNKKTDYMDDVSQEQYDKDMAEIFGE